MGAASLMAEANDPRQPKSITLMGGRGRSAQARRSRAPGEGAVPVGDVERSAVRPDRLPPPGGTDVKKSEQIASLKVECDRLVAERDAYRKALTLAHQDMRDLRAALAKRDQSLTDRVRSEFDAKWSWLLEAVGLFTVCTPAMIATVAEMLGRLNNRSSRNLSFPERLTTAGSLHRRRRLEQVVWRAGQSGLRP
jgi:hypothetical protein